MTSTEILKREVEVLIFDQYGTIVDMQTGLTRIATPFLQKKGWDGQPTPVRDVVAAHALRKLDD